MPSVGQSHSHFSMTDHGKILLILIIEVGTRGMDTYFIINRILYSYLLKRAANVLYLTLNRSSN
jgi:hypothetical protein